MFVNIYTYVYICIHVMTGIIYIYVHVYMFLPLIESDRPLQRTPAMLPPSPI
jgi:hypothetical protein